MKNGPGRETRPDCFAALSRSPYSDCIRACPGSATAIPDETYSPSLLRSVLIEILRILAAWVRLPRQPVEGRGSGRARHRPPCGPGRASPLSACLCFTRSRVATARRPQRLALGRHHRSDADLRALGQQHGTMDARVAFSLRTLPRHELLSSSCASPPIGLSASPLSRHTSRSDRPARGCRPAAGSAGRRRCTTLSR